MTILGPETLTSENNRWEKFITEKLAEQNLAHLFLLSEEEKSFLKDMRFVTGIHILNFYRADKRTFGFFFSVSYQEKFYRVVGNDEFVSFSGTYSFSEKQTQALVNQFIKEFGMEKLIIPT